MIYLSCRKADAGAFRIAEALGPSVKAFAGPACPPFHPLLTVRWGTLSGGEGSRVILNRYLLGGRKLRELVLLKDAGVRCVEFRTAPPREPSAAEWVPRAGYHEGGTDLDPGACTSPAFFTRFVSTAQEFRVHVFRGVCIDSALKYPTAGAHPWIKNHTHGWYFDYARGAPAPAVREAIAAVRAVRYDFGAVDVGVRHSGVPVVFEVNSAPGLEPPTAGVYAQAILAYYEEEVMCT